MIDKFYTDILKWQYGSIKEDIKFAYFASKTLAKEFIETGRAGLELLVLGSKLATLTLEHQILVSYNRSQKK